MNFFVRKTFTILFLLTIPSFISQVGAKESKIQYTKENISNYFTGIVSIDQNYNKVAFKHLKKVKSLKNSHQNYNVQFLRSLILLEKFDDAFSFSNQYSDLHLL